MKNTPAWLSAAIVMTAFLWAQGERKGLTITSAILQQYEDGPAVGPAHRFLAGETVHFSFVVQGYKTGGGGQVSLSYTIDAFDGQGTRLVESKAGKLETQLSELDKEWVPRIRYMFKIPPHAPLTDGLVKVTVVDEIAGTQATAEVPLRIQGKAVPPSDTLTVRNFRFLASEDAREPLVPPVYRGGSRIWARFDVTGYKIGENNRMDVGYGLAILSAAGKELFREPVAVREIDAPFYPKRFFEGILSLDVKPRTAPGEYVLVLFVDDAVGGQKYEGRYKFRVE